MSLYRTALLSLAFLPLAGTAAAAEGTPEAAVARYVKAEHDFDLPALRAILLPNFVEVSPRGEVDEHDAVLGFYAPEKKGEMPPTSLDDVKARVHGNSAFVTGTVVFTVKGMQRRLTLGASVVKGADGWRMASAQYTPVPPKTPPLPPVAPQPPAAPQPPVPGG